MPLTTEKVPQTRFDYLAEVEEWITETSDHLERVPIDGVLESGAEFMDDEYLGDGDTMLRFNERGMRALCQIIGFRFDQLTKLESPGLATAVVNDLLHQQEVRGRVAEAEFVIDDRSMTVIGTVSKSYVSYDNAQFLADIQEFLDSIKQQEPSEFREAYVVNTELTIRFCSTTRHGEITGYGGTGVDKTTLGLEFHNSMVGTSSVRANYFLYRLACANGMMVPAGESVSRIHHSGNRNTFNKRLRHRFEELVRKLDRLTEMLETLGAMPFEPKRLVSNREVNQLLFDVLPATRRTICDGDRLQLNYLPDATTEDKTKLRIEHDAKIAARIPDYFGGEHSRRIFE